MKRLWWIAFFCASACSSPDLNVADSGADASSSNEAGNDAISMLQDAGEAGALADAGDGGCFLSNVGVYGECTTTTDCTGLGDHISTPGYCPGPADIECCTVTPSVSDNPPVPMGWTLMQQSAVTADMTTWAVMILDDPTTYPMFSTTTKMFGSLEVLARVEWHPPDFQNSAIHRGVTLYD